jgi:hypothetical protein
MAHQPITGKYMMNCEERNKLEQAFLEARRQWLRYLQSREATAGEIDKLSRSELEALVALLDHRSEHGCQGATRTLPPRRNLGGIIGPY